MMEGAFPARAQGAVSTLRVAEQPVGVAVRHPRRLARSLGIPVVSSPEAMRDHEWLYYVGSAASFDPRGQKIATAFATVLRHAGVRSRSSAPRDLDWECVRRLGNEMLFQALAEPLVGH